jgi:hypothetical protein
MLGAMTEVASFLPDDPVELVEASLSCSVCLASVEWRLDDEWLDPSVTCRCRSCGHERRVYVTADQKLRLSLPMPAG